MQNAHTEASQIASDDARVVSIARVTHEDEENTRSTGIVFPLRPG